MAIDPYNQYGQYGTRPKFGRWLVLGIVVIVLVSVFFWFYTHAYLEIVVQNPANGAINYQLLDQSKLKNTMISSSSAHIKRLVSTGSLEVLIKQGSANSFSIIKTGRFLSSTTLTTSLSPEEGRRFIGDNPNTCMYFTGRILLSSECGGSFNSVRVHKPATDKQPTFTDTLRSSIDGTFEGLVKTNQGNLVLLQPFESENGIHTVYSLQDNLTLANGHVLSGLDPHKLYTIKSYGQGFIAYDTSFAQIVYFSSVSAAPVPIALPKLASGFATYAASVGANTIVIAYTNSEDTADTSVGSHPSELTKLVVVRSTNDVKQYTFGEQFGSVAACGDKLCLLANKELSVYDSSSSKPKLLYKIEGVLSMQESTHGLLFAREKELLVFDVSKQTGFSSYSYGDYTYCGLQPDESGYTLCLTNAKGKKTALHIDANTKSDDIDKKVSKLLQSVDVTSVSAYGKYIYVSPVLGNPVYDPAIRGYAPDPTALQKTKNGIGQTINSLGIDLSKYQIITTF